VPKKWVMDKNYEWEEIEIVPVPVVKTEPTSKRRKKPDPQIATDWCPCGRIPGPRDKIKWGKYCSRYCSIFHTQPAPGYKRKTHYECWMGTGSYAHSPVHPPLVVECEWCCKDMLLGYAISRSYDKNGIYRAGCRARFCGDTCRLEATQCSRKSKMAGTRRWNKVFEIVSYLRENGPSTAHQISDVVSVAQQYTFSPRTVSSLVRPLVSQGHLLAENSPDPYTPNVYSLGDPTKSPKEILIAMGANLK
jgi:hypothetical protein